MNPIQLHVAGATVRHQSPFSDLEVPETYGPPPAAYAFALAALDEPAGNAYLEEYLDYYLQRIDLWFDQGDVMAALAYLDKKNGTDKLSRFLPLWHAFVADKKSWDLGKSIAFFAETMDRLHALRHGRSTL